MRCRSCYLNERENAIQHSRVTAKRGQDKQILRMEKQSVKKARVLDIGDNILIPIPVFDKRSPFDSPNLADVIAGISEDGYYKIGTASGTLDRRYLSTEIVFILLKISLACCLEIKLNCLTSTSNLFHFSRKNRLYCSCTSGCNTNRCKCRRATNICNSEAIGN